MPKVTTEKEPDANVPLTNPFESKTFASKASMPLALLPLTAGAAAYGRADNIITDYARLLEPEEYDYFRNTCKDVLRQAAGQDITKVSDIPSMSSDIQASVLPLFLQGADSFTGSSPQSLYEAQASVISPLVVQMRTGQ